MRFLLYFIKKRATQVFEQEQEMVKVIFKRKLSSSSIERVDKLVRMLLQLFRLKAVRVEPKR